MTMCAPKEVLCRNGITLVLAVTLSFLSCIILTYCSKSLYYFLTGGHHDDTHTILLRMTQSAAFVAPAAVFVVQRAGHDPVILFGACLTIAGITTPSLFTDHRRQEIIFAVLYGAGVSIMFQSIFIAASSILRANIIFSALITVLTAIIMAIAQRAFDLIVAKFSERAVITVVLALPIICVLFSFAQVLIRRKSTQDQKPCYNQVIDTKTSKDQNITINEEICDTSKSHFYSPEDIVTRPDGSCSGDVTLKLYAFLWWATGIQLTLLSSRTKEFSENIKLLTLMSIMSLFTFGIRILVMERKLNPTNGCVWQRSAGYFLFGIFGIGGVVLQCFSQFTDMHCYVLLFSMGFFHLLNLLEVSPKTLQNFDGISCMINQICVELVLTLCAMAVGYLFAHVIYYSVVTAVASSAVFSDISHLVLSSVLIIVSLVCSIKGQQSSTFTTETNSINEE